MPRPIIFTTELVTTLWTTDYRPDAAFRCSSWLQKFQLENQCQLFHYKMVTVKSLCLLCEPFVLCIILDRWRVSWGMAPLIISLHPQMTFIVKIGHFCYWTPRLMSDCVNIFYLTTLHVSQNTGCSVWKILKRGSLEIQHIKILH